MKNIIAIAHKLGNEPTRIKLSATTASRAYTDDGDHAPRNRSRNELGKTRSAKVRAVKRSGAFA